MDARTCSPSPRVVNAGQRLTLLLCRLHGCGCMSGLGHYDCSPSFPDVRRSFSAIQNLALESKDTGDPSWLEYLNTRSVDVYITIRPPTRVESNTHKMNHYHHAHHSQPHQAQGHYPQAHYPQATHAQAYHSQSLSLTRNFLTDGYISYTFKPQIAEIYLVQLLFKVPDTASIHAIRDPSGNGAYFVFNPPSYYSQAPFQIQGRGAWVLDHDVRSGGSVVPQELWFPQGQGDRRRYVEQASFRMPVFFVSRDGGLGVPVMNAAAGHMNLRDEYLPPPLQDKTTAKIRIAWPGYAASEKQVQLRDQTSDKSPILFDRFVKHVGSRVQRFLMDCEQHPPIQPFKWMVGHGNITPEEVMLIGIVQVSEGSWMPILQLTRRVVI